jgi:glycosyltransferase involved in cell wall biosynthesis
MKIACVIDHLGPGGAQRQMVTLARLLRERGHSPLVLTYHENDFFRAPLEAAGIEAKCLPGTGRLRRAMVLRQTLLAHAPEAVLAFVDGPCVYAELAGLPSRRWGLVVSERSRVPRLRLGLGGRRLLHLLADYVTTNSHAAQEALATGIPWLSRRLVTIYNGLDLATFTPAPANGERKARALRFLVAASYRELKNATGLVQAVGLVKELDPSLPVEVDWYGEPAYAVRGIPDTRYREQVKDLIEQLSLGFIFRLHPATKDIVQQYQSADAVVLPSFIEGLPNAVCEGMACGCPILASRIGDAEMLVEAGVNGFLFDPTQPEDMAHKILEFGRLPYERRQRMGGQSRRRAEELFAPGPIVNAYVGLLQSAAQRRARRPSYGPAPSLATGR